MLRFLSAPARAYLEGVLILKYTPEQIINDPFLNKGTAFTQAERNQYGLNGLLPPAVQTLDQQVKQAYAQLKTKPTDLAKRQFLMTLFNENHVLFYKLFSEHINEFMPIVYDPTIADTIENYSALFVNPQNATYLSIDDPDHIESALKHSANGRDIRLLVGISGYMARSIVALLINLSPRQRSYSLICICILKTLVAVMLPIF